jgi:hypothetical protein
VKVIALAIVLTACAAAGPAERVTLPTNPPSQPWAVMRDTLIGCALQQGLVGPIEARVSFDPDGAVASVGSGYGDPFARCVGVGLGHTHFRRESGRTLVIAFTSVAPPLTASCETTPAPCETQGPAN